LVGSRPILGAYFVRLGDTEDTLKQDSLIFSETLSNSYVYLLNAQPGRYAVVAVSVYHSYGRSTCLLPKSIVQQTVTNVAPGAIGYLGDYKVETSYFARGGMENDDVENYYFDILSTERFIRRPVFSAKFVNGSRDEQGERQFLEHTDQELLAKAGGSW